MTTVGTRTSGRTMRTSINEFITEKLRDVDGLAAARSIRATHATVLASSATLGANRLNHPAAYSSLPQSELASSQAACSSAVAPHGKSSVRIPPLAVGS